MTVKQRIQRGAAAALMIASLGACAGNSLGNILGGVLGGGGGAQSGQLAGTVTVSLPYNPSTNDANTFNRLRSGDYVRFYGTYLGNSRVELRQFY
jgi:hypothetical protein